MNVLWIADAHLSNPEAPMYGALRDLVLQSMETVDCLVILGDLFELWLGDNQILLSRHKKLLEIFSEYRNQGKAIYYLKGNHDFVLGRVFENHIGAEIFEEEAIFDWDGYRFFASHGENINKRELGYQLLRKILRSRWADRAIGRLDDRTIYQLGMRLAPAMKGTPNERKTRALDLLYLDYAKRRLRESCHAVILAHTHRIQWHILSVGDEKRLYVNPGSWQDQGTYLWYQTGRFQIRKLQTGTMKILFDFAFPVL